MNRRRSIRDDSSLDRLYYFLVRKGRLSVQDLERIKPNVYNISTPSKKWIVKSYGNKKKVRFLWEITSVLNAQKGFLTAPFVPFPSGDKVLENEGKWWCLMPFIEGESLTFSSSRDRLAAVSALHQLHDVTEGMKVSQQVNRPSYLTRMEKRLAKFLKTREIFFQYGHYPLYSRIKQLCVHAFRQMEQVNWDVIEDRSKNNGHWIHGDCASHNFIRQGDDIYVIDLDLMHQAPYVLEWLQLAQRFLYASQWSFYSLNESFTMRQYMKSPYFQRGLLFPGDLLREWIFFLNRKPASRRVEHMLNQMQTDWAKRERFVKELMTVI